MLFKAAVTATNLHVRQGPGRSFDSIDFVTKGMALNIDSIDNTGTWLHFQQNTIKKSGWCYAPHLQPLTTQKAPWLAIASKEVGVKEWPGTGLANIHPRIGAYLASVNNLSNVDKSNDETPWCSCFINWCVEQVDLDGTDSAWAKSWGNWKNAIALAKAEIGDIAVFERSSATVSAGHVAILIAKDLAAGQVSVLGGNQSNAVRYSWYPLDQSINGTHYKLLSCRRI